MLYSADFETSVLRNTGGEIEETWVYLWGSMNIETEEITYGRTIKEFINYVRTLNDKDSIYFHNLKFDGSFILNELFSDKNNYLKVSNEDLALNEELKELDNIILDKMFKRDYIYIGILNEDGTGAKDTILIRTAISNTGIWYSLELTIINENEKPKKITIYDSLKLLNYTVAEIATEFLNLPNYEKLEYDYDIVRRPEDKLEKEDYDYLKRDCEIVSRALNILKNEYNVSKNTTASASLYNFKKTIFNSKYQEEGTDKEIDNLFRQYFPIIKKEENDFAFMSYKGGLSYVNPTYRNKIIGTGDRIIGITIDANSLYPSVMTKKGNKFPIGEGVYYQGKYVDNEKYDLYIQRIRCKFKLKKDKLPIVNLKTRDFREFNKKLELPINEIIESSNGETVELYFNSVDLKAFLDNYKVKELEYVDGYMYESIEGIFVEYMKYWENVKTKAVKEHNKTLKGIAKLFLNGLYGKYGTKSSDVKWKVPYLKNGVLKFKTTTPRDEDPVYMPMASFITAYSRKELITVYNIVVKIGKEKYGVDYNPFCYCDTDSLHILLTLEDIEDSELEDYIDDGSSFGKWKIEEHLYKTLYIRSKTYLEQVIPNNEIENAIAFNNNKSKEEKAIKIYANACAGLPKKEQGKLDFDNFYMGAEYEEVKLMPKQVKGGMALVKSNFKIKE